MNNTPHILHVFDPGFKHGNHEEVEFVKGRYIDIANAKHKDPRTLYFGTSTQSNLLTGIFLGDIELTSKVKDVSLVSENGAVTLSVKYVNSKSGKLSTVKTSIPSSKTIDEIKKLLNNIDTNAIKNLNSSINDLSKKVNSIDSSLSKLNSSFVILSEQVTNLIDDISTLKLQADYTIHYEEPTENNNYNKQYKLFNGDKEKQDSSIIEITDSKLQVLKYNKDTNTLEAKSWSSYINETDETKIDDKFVNTVSIQLDSLDEHIKEEINTDSSVNDRLTIVESQLRWESIK